MRRIWAGQTSLVVLLAFFGMPFLHLHTVGQPADGGRLPLCHDVVIHAHLPDAHVAHSEVGGHNTELSHPGHDAKPLNVFAVGPNSSPVLMLPFLTAERAELVRTSISVEGVIPEFTWATHDPPLIDKSGPRAPPA